tara:strand:- start:2401 stop:3237 length:837 start_codon:yes stop_codon:yes gene_type:complete
MRLGQLARQLDTKPEKIVSFLEKEKSVTIKSHPNCKVEDDLIEEITKHFKPIVTEEIITPTPSKEKKVKAVAETPKTEAPIAEAIETPAPIEHIETKKAPAPQELKIIGKIDLPNKKEVSVEVDGVVYDQETLDEKKKEDLKANKEKKAIEKEAKKKADDEKRKLAKEKREVEAERKAMLATEKSNQLTKEAERKKEIVLKAQKEREAKLEKKRKKRQADHYTQNVTAGKTKKKKTATKAAINTEATLDGNKSEASAKPIEEVQEKSIYKRFIKWLNT